jgi:hypothetical protein
MENIPLPDEFKLFSSKKKNVVKEILSSEKTADNKVYISASEIAKKLNTHRTTIAKIIQDFCKIGFLENLADKCIYKINIKNNVINSTSKTPSQKKKGDVNLDLSALENGDFAENEIQAINNFVLYRNENKKLEKFNQASFNSFVEICKKAKNWNNDLVFLINNTISIYKYSTIYPKEPQDVNGVLQSQHTTKRLLTFKEIDEQNRLKEKAIDDEADLAWDKAIETMLGKFAKEEEKQEEIKLLQKGIENE